MPSAGSRAARVRPQPSAGLTWGSLLAAGGYLLPWFKAEDHEWWFSGRQYLLEAEGGGWTSLTLLFFAVATLTGLYAERSQGAAVWSVVTVVSGGFFAAVVVAASFSAWDGPGGISRVADASTGLGLPVLAVGLGTAVVGGCRVLGRG